MHKIDHKNTGFGVVEIIIAVVVVLVVGLVGWRLYDASKNKPSASTQQPSSSQPNEQTSSDPYAGWKTYCDDAQKACFKYPSDWTVDPSSQNGIVSVTLKSPSGAVVGGYVNSDTRDGVEMPYYTASVDGLSMPDSKYKVVGGFTFSGSDLSPRYKVVDASFASGLKPGQQTSLTNTARFTYKDGSTTGHLEAYPISASGFTSDQAKAWFGSDDAKTALQVVRSFSLR